MTSIAKHSVPMILAAGLGTRLEKHTINQPKALVKIGGTSLLELTLNQLKKYGFELVIINIHHFGQQILKFLVDHDNFGMEIRISDETNQLMNTGGALLKALPLVPANKQLLVHNVDIISTVNLKLLANKHLSSGAAATLVVRDRDSSRKLIFNEKMQLEAWRNTLTGQVKKVGSSISDRSSAFAFSGIHMANPEQLRKIPVEPCSLIDLYLKLAKFEKIYGFFDSSAIWFDVGNPDQLAALNKNPLAY